MASRKHHSGVQDPEDEHKKPSRRLSAAEIDSRLEEFRTEIEAGIPDDEVAKMAGGGVRKTHVARWRAKNDIRRARHPARKAEIADARIAMNLLGEPLEDVLQRSHGSVVRGSWEPPKYLVRQGVNYDKLCWQIYLMKTVLGLSLEDIASAHGYTLKTVKDAFAAEQEHLRKKGSKCKRCGVLVEPDFDYGCSGICIGVR